MIGSKAASLYVTAVGCTDITHHMLTTYAETTACRDFVVDFVVIIQLSAKLQVSAAAPVVQLTWCKPLSTWD